VLGAFFGLPLDMRHVTLSTGTLALACADWAVAGSTADGFCGPWRGSESCSCSTSVSFLCHTASRAYDSRAASCSISPVQALSRAAWRLRAAARADARRTSTEKFKTGDTHAQEVVDTARAGVLRNGTFTFGGGDATTASLQRELVANREWLSEHDFAACYAVSRVTPNQPARLRTAVGWTSWGCAGAVGAPGTVPGAVVLMLMTGSTMPPPAIPG
jgi:hypothetical protein